MAPSLRKYDSYGKLGCSSVCFPLVSQLVCFKLPIPYFCHQDNMMGLNCEQWTPFYRKNRKMFSETWALVRARLWIILTFFPPFLGVWGRTQGLKHVRQVFSHWGRPLIPHPQTYKDFDVLNCSYGWTFLTQNTNSILISTWEILLF